MVAERAAVRIRRHSNGPDCDVIVTAPSLRHSMIEASAPPEAGIGTTARCGICWHGRAICEWTPAARLARTLIDGATVKRAPCFSCSVWACPPSGVGL
jgi:hypothetical protein